MNTPVGDGTSRRTTAAREVLSSLPPNHFEQIRRNAAKIQRLNNVDVVTTPQNDTYAFCHMPYFYAFSYRNSPDTPRQPWNFKGPWEGAAAIHLAMLHLNTGDGSVIPQVQGLNETCNVRFTFEIEDTEHYETITVDKLLDTVDREPSSSLPLPCAILGASRSAVTIPMAIFSGVKGYPQMSAFSTSSQLDDRSQYRLFSRLIPSDDGTAVPVILYLRDIIKTDHLAVVHTNNAYSISFMASLQKAGTELAPTMNIQSIDLPLNIITDKDVQTAVKFLKSTNFRYIFAIIEGAQVYERFMMEAHRQGIAGDDYVWIFSDSLHPASVTDREYESRDSPMAVVARGSSMLFVQPRIPGTPALDTLVSSVQELQNHPDHVEFLQSKHPVYKGEPDYDELPVERIFKSPDLGVNAVFLYDSTIAMGLAACAAADPVTYFDGVSHYEHIINTSFVGATGPIVVDPTTGSRDFTTAYYQLLNFVEREDPETGNITFDAVRTDIFRDGTWSSLTPYIYGDGTTNMPPPLPKVQVDYNYLNDALRGIGFALSAIIILLSIAFGVWTIRYRTGRVVKASQPIFLLFICGGVLLMGSAIIPLSFDDKIASKAGCDLACQSTPWLFILGFALAFSALFSKTWRINKIFHNPSLKRIKVTPFDVMAPLVALLLVDAVTLALWTGIDPLVWEREILRVDVFGQTVETGGICKSDAFAGYVSVLVVANMGGLVVASFQAYQARDIAVEFSESTYTGRAIGLFLLACLYGIPVLAITWENPSTRYFVLMIIASVCSLSVLLLIFVPKIIYHRRGDFKKASHVVSIHVRSSEGLKPTSNGTTFVTGLSQGSPTDNFPSEDVGLEVVDHPSNRSLLKEENQDLLKEQKVLKDRLKRAEEIERLHESSISSLELASLMRGQSNGSMTPSVSLGGELVFEKGG